MPHPEPLLTIVTRAVLFDMDGVLISSTAADERSWSKWARLHGMEGTFSLHSTHGRRTIDTIRALRPDLDALAEQERMETFDIEDDQDVVLYPGVQRLLAELPTTRWAIVTSASDRVLCHRLGHLGISPPPCRVTAGDVRSGKPSPEPYQLGAARLGLPNAECLVIEDSPSGIHSGKAAGSPVLAVASSHPPAQLHEADWIVPSLDDLELSASSNATLTFRFKDTSLNNGIYPSGT